MSESKVFKRTSNPVLNDKKFTALAKSYSQEIDSSNVMTLNGTIGKTAILLFILIMSAAYIWSQYMGESDLAGIGGWIFIALIGALILALVVIFNPPTAPFLSPIYAILEGIVIGLISVKFEQMYPGIVMPAVALTFGTLFILLLIYRSGFIPVTENFYLGVSSATGAIALLYMVNIGLRFFFKISIPLIHDGGWLGILFSLFVVTIAALNLVLDFDFIEKNIDIGAPKFMEWYGAFGLLITLVWLYFEILRLLGKSRK